MFKRSRLTTRMPDWPAAMSAAVSGLLITGQGGFVAGTHVASNLGWRVVDALSVGDKVLTFDHGMQMVRDIQRETLFKRGTNVPRAQRPILIPQQALGNRKPIWLMPEQGLVVESDTAGEVLGDPFIVMPARALVGFRGIRPAKPEDELRITTLAFARDEAVYVEGGMLAHCPRPRSILTDAEPRPETEEISYKLLDMRAARHLVRCLIDEDDPAALLCDPDELALVPEAPPERPRRGRPAPRPAAQAV